jgi:hypothetical protein
VFIGGLITSAFPTALVLPTTYRWFAVERHPRPIDE